MTRSLLGSIILTLLFVGQTAPASAQTTTINFDDLAPGTIVSSQYHDRGVDFSSTPLYPGGGAVLPKIQAAPNTSSPPNALSILGLCSGEFCPTALVGRFDAPRRHVSVMVGDFSSVPEDENVQLTAYDAAGAIVSRDTLYSIRAGDPFRGPLVVASTSADIWSFDVVSAMNHYVAIDDLTFDAVGPAAADFALLWPGPSPVSLDPGFSVRTSLVLQRFGTSSGDITLSTFGLPPGIVATFIPNPVSRPDGTTITLELTAVPGALPFDARTFRVVGTPSSTAGSFTRSVELTVLVRDSYAPRITGIEVTQGVQSRDLPRRGPDPRASVSYNGGTRDEAGRPLQDRGVRLAMNAKTIVRVFASQWFSSLIGRPPPVDAVLRACDRITGACGPALSSETGPLTLFSGSNYVDDGARGGFGAVFTFTLPPSWTTGWYSLEAEILPPGAFSGGPSACEQPDCVAFRRLRLFRGSAGSMAPDRVRARPGKCGPSARIAPRLGMRALPSSGQQRLRRGDRRQRMPQGRSWPAEGPYRRSEARLSALAKRDAVRVGQRG